MAPVRKDIPELHSLYINHTPVRSTSKLLQGGIASGPVSQPSAPSKHQAAAPQASPHDMVLNMRSCFMESFKNNPKITYSPGAKQQAPSPNRALTMTAESLGKPCCNHKLALPSKESLGTPCSNQQKLALPAPPQNQPAPALPLPGKQEQEESPKDEAMPQQGSSDRQGPAHNDLESFENAAFDALQARAKSQRAPCMKKPARGKARAKAKAASKTQHSKAKVAGPQTKKGKQPTGKLQGWGCTRCRASMAGCGTCSKPGYDGKKSYSKAEYKAYTKKKSVGKK